MTQFKKTALIILLLLLIPAILIGINLIRNSAPQTVKTKAVTNLRMFFSPSNSNDLGIINKNDQFGIDLVLNPAGKLVAGVDISLSYGNGEVSLVEFDPDTASSGFDTEIIKGEPDNYSHSLRYVAVNKGGNLPPRSTIRLGTLKFKAQANSGSFNLHLNKVQIASPNDKQATILTSQETEDGQYTIGASPSPSASASVSPSPSAPPPTVCIDGAVKGHACVDNSDVIEWVKEFTGISSAKDADFYPQCRSDNTRGDGVIDFKDYEVWRRAASGPNKCH